VYCEWDAWYFVSFDFGELLWPSDALVRHYSDRVCGLSLTILCFRMCLEFCGQGGELATEQLDQIEKHTNLVSAVSFEKYTLGANMTLLDNNLTEVLIDINLVTSLHRLRCLIALFHWVLSRGHYSVHILTILSSWSG
jgi:hypothetical protein